MDWGQFRTILWLRWRLAVNQWTRGSGLGAIIAGLLAVAALASACSTFGLGLLAGSKLLSSGNPVLLLLVFDAIIGVFLFFWLIGVANELQRSEIVDLPRIMHLPVSLREGFLINYLASHITFSLVLFGPGLAGLLLGLAFGRGWNMAWLALPVVGFFFAVTAWTYCLRGWLAAIMLNARRKRTILVFVTIGVMLLAQLPNLYFNVLRPRSHPQPFDPGHPVEALALPENLPSGVLSAHLYVPPLWLGYAAMELANGGKWPAILSGIAWIAIGAAGFRQAVRSTLRFYYGTQKPPRRAKAPPPLRTGTLLVERSIPGLPEPAAAVALASLRAMSRAPELRMILGSAVVMLIVFGVIFVRPGSAPPPDWAKPWTIIGVILLCLMTLSQLYANQFGADRDGFRSYVLTPISRTHILLGKNLALLPFLAGLPVLVLAVQVFLFHLAPADVVAAIFQILSACLIVIAFGNWVSICFPFHVAPGSLRPTKTSPQTSVAMFVCTLAIPVLLLPVCLPPALEAINHRTNWADPLPLNLYGSVAVFAATLLVYRKSLSALAPMLERRETTILAAVTRTIE